MLNRANRVSHAPTTRCCPRLAGVWLCGAALAAAQADDVTGSIQAVTVYRGQAMVTRSVSVSGAAGLAEVVVTGLPEKILPSTLFAEAGEGVEVRSVRYRTRPVEQDVREEVRKLDEQIRVLDDQLAANERFIALLAERRAYLDRLEQFTAATATVDLTHGVLDADTLTQLSEYLVGQRRSMAEEELTRASERRELQEQRQLRQRERDVLTGGSARTVREAVVFVNVVRPGGAFLLRYLVQDANWTPSYTIRTDGQRKGLTVEYNAAIEQRTGEDWSDVEMTLSTATPSLTARAPQLLPLEIALAAPAPSAQGGGGGPMGYVQARKELERRKQEADELRVSNTLIDDVTKNAAGAPITLGLDANLAFDKSLNEVAQQMQVLDLVYAAYGVNKKEEVEPMTESLSVTYQLPGRMSLPSRADRQFIQIAALPMTGEFYKVATPVLTGYVYDEARVANSSPLVLLAGPVMSYVAGQFVGQSLLPTVAAGESFTIGLGIDASLRASRELVEKKESVQGGNRVVDFTYRLAVENFGAAPVEVRVLDRIPVARGNELKVTLMAGPAGQPEITQTSREQKDGLIRTLVACKPRAADGVAASVTYQFRLEYDRQMSITGLPIAQAGS